MNRNLSFTEDLLFNLRSSEYHGSLPYFYSDTDFPELAVIKDNWKTIFEEIQTYEQEHGNITEISTYSPPELVGENLWNNIYLENFMWQFHNHRKHFPVTCSLLNQISGCTLAVISILSPQSTIATHYSDTNSVIRCHLGLQVPAPYPECGIQVGTE
jgi:aspartyl/asparaginyl beta-hydroxylase (cupin superfamily)